MVLWGAEVLMWSERQFATHVLESWRAGRSSLLRSPAPEHMEIPEAALV
jgi:hypothetical protein